MDGTKLRSAVLVVSETASKDPSTDRSGDILKDLFLSDGQDKWDVPVVRIVSDDVLSIQRTIQQWSDTAQYLNLVVTTGGTGFAVEDHTPEVPF